jgi:D-sedoheptulose 7-phosphate isomerase
MEKISMGIENAIQESILVKQKILKDREMMLRLENIIAVCVNAYRAGKKVFFCGNGGSAADAQHLAAELSGRFYFDRPPLDSDALHVNTSYLTAVANDYSYDEIYSRLIRAKGRQGDVLFALSTSGNSPNILKAVEAARDAGMTAVGMTGESGGKMKNLCDFLLNVPSSDTPRIQEAHILLGHILCEHIENNLFPK